MKMVRKEVENASNASSSKKIYRWQGKSVKTHKNLRFATERFFLVIFQ